MALLGPHGGCLERTERRETLWPSNRLEAANLCCLSEGQSADECEAGDGGGKIRGRKYDERRVKGGVER